MRKITKDRVCSSMGKKYGLASCRSLWPYSRHRSRLGHFVGRLKVVQSAPEDSRTLSLDDLASAVILRDHRGLWFVLMAC